MIFTHCELGDARSGKKCQSSVNAIQEGIAVLCYINFELMDITALKCLNDVSALFNSYIHDSNKIIVSTYIILALHLRYIRTLHY